MDGVDETSGSPMKRMCCSYFREDGGCVFLCQSHMPESLPEYFPDFDREDPSYALQWGLLGVSISSPMRGLAPVRFLGK